MTTPKLTPMAERMLILVGRTLEQAILDQISATDDSADREIGDGEIREAFDHLAARGFDTLSERVDASEKRLRSFKIAG